MNDADPIAADDASDVFAARKFAPTASPPYLFVNATQAAQRTGVSKDVVKLWAAQGLIGSLKPGSDASHRLIDVYSLVRHIEQKYERANADARDRLQMEQEQLVKPSEPRTVLYMRQAPPTDEEMSDDELTLATKPLEAKCMQMRQLLRLDPSTCFFASELNNDHTDLNRVGFVELMKLVLDRSIDRLVITDREQVCPNALWPLFDWLCRHHDVAIDFVPLPAASISTPLIAS